MSTPASSEMFNFNPNTQSGHNVDSRRTPPLAAQHFDMQNMYQTPFNGHPQWSGMPMFTPNGDMFTPNYMSMMQMHQHNPIFISPPTSSDESCATTPASASSNDTESPATGSDSSPSDVKDIPTGMGALWPNASSDLAGAMDQKFDEVPGRLCLLSASTKYKVTLGEMIRRMSQPETLHTSLMNGILRKGKARDNGNRLRRALDQYGIKLPSGRRKTAPTTSFTAFCEAEAVNLARDFCVLTARDGGADAIANELSASKPTDELKADLANKMDNVLKGLEEIRRLYAALSPLPEEIKPKTDAETAINRYSLLTHGFGHTAMLGAIDHLRKVAHQTITSCGHKPSTGMPMPSHPHGQSQSGMLPPPAEMSQQQSMMPGAAHQFAAINPMSFYIPPQ